MQAEPSCRAGTRAIVGALGVLALAVSLPARAETRVGGEIAASTVWTLEGSPYVLGSTAYVRGTSGPVLTIEPGVVVKAEPGASLSVGSGANGVLRALGTAEKPIVFTAAGAAVAGAWSGLLLAAGSQGSRIENAIVEGAGQYGRGAVVVAAGTTALKDLIVRTSLSRGVSVEPGGAPEISGGTVTGTTGSGSAGIYVGVGGRPVLRNVTVESGAAHGIVVAAGGSADLADSTIRGNSGGAIFVEAGAELVGLTGLVLSGNGQDGVRHGGGELRTSETWRSFGYPYFVLNASVAVSGPTSPVLTIEPGVVVKVGDYWRIAAGESGSGSLRAVGTPEKPIVFTAAGAAAAGKWPGLLLGAGSQGSRIENAIVEGAGKYGRGAVVVAADQTALKALLVRTCANRGLAVESGGAPEIIGATVTGTTGSGSAGIYVGAGGRPVLRGVTVESGAAHGVVVAAGGRADLADSTIRGNAGGAISVEAGAELAGLTGLVLSGNGQDGVRHGGGELRTSETWRSFGYPYFLLDASAAVSGPASPVLTIEPGVVVKVGDYWRITAGESGSGSLRAVGTPEKPIVFTAASAVAAGAWPGLLLGAKSQGSRIENAIVEGAGKYGRGAVVVAAGATEMKSVLVRTSSSPGISMEPGAAPEIADVVVTGTSGSGGAAMALSAGSSARIERTTISGNAGTGILNDGSASRLRFVTITANGAEALRSAAGELALRDSTVTGQGVPVRNSDSLGRAVDARQQWWGRVDGPVGNVGRVEVEPWLAAPPADAFPVTWLEASTRSFAAAAGAVRFDAELPSAGRWKLSLKAPDGSDARLFEGSGPNAAVTWDGTGAGGTPLADGSYAYRFEATEESTGRASVPLAGRVSLDASLPVATLISPAGVVRVSAGAEIEISGSAAGAGFQSYLLEFGPGDFPPAYTAVDRGSLPVTNAKLGSWTTALLPAGRYTLRLSVTGSAGKVAVTTSRVELQDSGECR